MDIPNTHPSHFHSSKNKTFLNNCLVKASYLKGKQKLMWKLDPSKCLTPEEVKLLQQRLNKQKYESKFNFRAYFVVNLGLFTGLRISEMKDLVMEDISIFTDMENLDIDSIKIHPYSHPYVLVRRGKGGKSRKVRIGSDFIEIVFEYYKWKISMREPLKNNSPLLYSPKSKGRFSRSGLYFLIKRVLKSAGKDFEHFSPHSLRHTYGAHLYKASKYNIRLVQKQMGHSSVKVTEVYVDIFNDDLSEALDNLYCH